MKNFYRIVLFSLLAALAGCGSDNTPVATKTATLTFTNVSTSRLTVPINGIQVVAKLPPGVIIPTDPANPSKIAASALTAGSAVTSSLAANEILIFGSYSASISKVRLIIADNSASQKGFRSGDYLTLSCSIPLVLPLTVSSFTDLNGSFPNTATDKVFKAGGFDVATHSDVDLTNQLTRSLRVVIQ